MENQILVKVKRWFRCSLPSPRELSHVILSFLKPKKTFSGLSHSQQLSSHHILFPRETDTIRKELPLVLSWSGEGRNRDTWDFSGDRLCFPLSTVKWVEELWKINQIRCAEASWVKSTMKPVLGNCPHGDRGM